MKHRRILLVAAMPTESRAAIAQYKMAALDSISSFFSLYKAKDRELYLVLTHVGMTNAAAGVALAIAATNPDVVLKIGCVGGNAPGVNKNDHILATKFFHTGAWITRHQRTLKSTECASAWMPLFGDLPYQNSRDNLGGLDYILSPDATLTDWYGTILKEQGVPYHEAVLGSSDMVLTDHKLMKHIRSDLLGLDAQAPWCTDNESYSVMQVCSIHKIPATGVYFVASSDYEDVDGYDPDAIDRQTADILMPALTALLERIQ
jgi:nucleoside phosphorylase